MMGVETPQAPPMTARNSSPPPKILPQQVQAPYVMGPPPLTERGNMGPLVGNDPQSQIQMQLQAKAQQQILAFQALVQAQAQAYAMSQIQPQVQALTMAQMPVGQVQSPQNQAQAFAQMQQNLLSRQGSLVQMQRQPPQQQLQPEEMPHVQMNRQLQEQMVAQVWAQASVQQQRESQPMLTARGRPTLVRQTSWAQPPSARPSAATSVPQGIASSPAATAQRLEAPRTVDAYQVQELMSARVRPTASAEAPVTSEAAEAEAELELNTDVVVRIDGSKFQIMQPLGMGSYGMVWSALSEDSNKEVAVKEILCRSQGELSIAHFEGTLLETLGRMEIGACKNGRLPALVAQETHAFSAQKSWRVRLAMSRIPGIPLMILLEQHREYKKALSDPSSNGNAESIEPPPFFPERSLPRLEGETLFTALLRKLYDPCLYTKELIVQIFPTLERIAAVAYHRDINPRNILIDSPKRPGPPNYGLVDFGMAVDAGQWRADARGNWNTLEVGGDCRYWPVSAWVMFLHGPQELTPGSPWRIEYQTQLDIHALGITALQVFVELLPSMSDFASGSDGDDDGYPRTEYVLLDRVKALINAWAQYWEDAMDFWHCLIDCFTNNGDWNALKRACINHGVQDAITKDLTDLRTTLSDAASAFAAASDTSSPASLEASRELQAVFNAIRALISVGDTTQFPTWRSIHSILGLPASMEDLATIRLSHVTGSGSIAKLGTSVSTNKLSSTTLAPARSCYNMITPSATPGPIITRGISMEGAGPKSSPLTARRQASIVRDVRDSSVQPNRMVSVVTSGGSPMCSPRRGATVVVDAAGRNAVFNTQHSTMREPLTGRRSGTNIAASPPGPSRALRRERSLTSDPAGGQRSKSALAPSNLSYNQAPPEFSPHRFIPNIMRTASTNAGPQSAVVRGTSVVSAAGLHESSSSAGVRASSVTTSSSPDFASPSRTGGMVHVITKSPSAKPDCSPGQVIRGSSVVASAANFKRNQSPSGRGSSVVIETTVPSRGPSVVTSANRGSSVSVDAAAPATARRATNYAAEPGGSPPSQGVRLVLPSTPAILSARQWGPLSSRTPAQGIVMERVA